MLFGMVALFAVGTSVQSGWVLAMVALLGGIVVVGVLFPFRAFTGLRIRRECPRVATADGSVGVSLVVTNAGRRPRGLVRLDDVFLGRASGVVGLLGPGQSRTYRSRRQGARRGVYTSGPCKLTSGAPFGLVLLRKTVDVDSTILVRPRVFVPHGELSMGREGLAAAPVGDTVTVREYVPGEPLRHVHWPSSARRGTLLVREFEAGEGRRLILAADTPPNGRVADAVASAACSLGMDVMRQGYELSLATPGADLERADGSDDVLDWGARLEGDGSEIGPLLAGVHAGALACVLEASPRTQGVVDELARRASTDDVHVVLIGDDVGDAHAHLTGAGATVGHLSVEGVEALCSASASA